MLEKFHKALFESDNGFMDTRGHPMNHMTKNCDIYIKEIMQNKRFLQVTHFHDKKNDYATTFYHKQLFKKRKNITLLMIYGEVD